MKRLLAVLALAASPALAEDPITEMAGACHAPTGSVGQAASLLSTVGWQVGGEFERAMDARAIVIPYLSGKGEQDLRRNGVDYYVQEGIAQAAEEATRSGFLTSPEGHTIMITHTGDAVECTLALEAGANNAVFLNALPDEDSKGNDPQMEWYFFTPMPPPPGVTGAKIELWDPDEHDYTRANPVRPRDVKLIITMRARMQ